MQNFLGKQNEGLAKSEWKILVNFLPLCPEKIQLISNLVSIKKFGSGGFFVSGQKV
jgi:hypothetical protein